MPAVLWGRYYVGGDAGVALAIMLHVTIAVGLVARVRSGEASRAPHGALSGWAAVDGAVAGALLIGRRQLPVQGSAQGVRRQRDADVVA